MPQRQLLYGHTPSAHQPPVERRRHERLAPASVCRSASLAYHHFRYPAPALRAGFALLSEHRGEIDSTHKKEGTVRITTRDVFTSDFGGLLPSIPPWVQRGVGRRLSTGTFTIVSAVCPDYDREDGRFTYRGMGDGVPYTASRHLELMAAMLPELDRRGIRLDYYMTLADTEFDLPLVVGRMADGDADEFLRRCQRSCERLVVEAQRLGVPLRSCRRFTDEFDWFPTYHEALAVIDGELAGNASVRGDAELSACRRRPLYQAMADQTVSQDYCRSMVLRQWAQYMAWGKLARGRWPDLVMVNHSTPNLTRVNHAAFRAGERTPILELAITTMPG